MTRFFSRALARRMLALLLTLVVAGCGGGQSAPPIEGGETIPNLPTSEVPGTQVVVEKSGPHLPSGRLLFSHSGNLWVLADTELRQLSTSGKTLQPTWAPDGRRIAYVQREESYADIYIRSVEGEGRGVQLTRGEPAGIPARSLDHVRSVRWSLYPTWSPSGAYLAFVSQPLPPSCDGRGGGGACDNAIEYPLSLYLARVDTTGANLAAGSDNLVLVKADTDIGHLSWSPDGNLIAFAMSQRFPAPDTSGLRIGLYNVQTGREESAEAILDGSYDPAWSPDGRWLAYARREGGTTDLWVIPAPGSPSAGAPARRLTTIGTVRAPAWSPDGRHLAFLRVDGGSVAIIMATVGKANDGFPALGEPQVLVANEPIDVDSGLSWAAAR